MCPLPYVRICACVCRVSPPRRRFVTTGRDFRTADALATRLLSRVGGSTVDSSLHETHDNSHTTSERVTRRKSIPFIRTRTVLEAFSLVARCKKNESPSRRRFTTNAFSSASSVADADVSPPTDRACCSRARRRRRGRPAEAHRGRCRRSMRSIFHLVRIDHNIVSLRSTGLRPSDVDRRPIVASDPAPTLRFVRSMQPRTDIHTRPRSHGTRQRAIPPALTGRTTLVVVFCSFGQSMLCS